MGLFSQLLAPKAESPPGSEESSVHSHVTDPEMVAGICRQLSDEHRLLSVSLPQSGMTYTSSILKVDTDRGELWLDELLPAGGHERLMQAKRLDVHTHFEGVALSFNCSLEDLFQSNGISTYKVSFPAQIEYLQRRNHYRVKMTEEEPVSLAIVESEDMRIIGQLRDLSIGGIGAIITSDRELVFEEGERLQTCVIQLQVELEVTSSLEVRYQRGDRQHQRKWRLGARFLELERGAQMTLSRYIAEQDRKQRRERVSVASYF